MNRQFKEILLQPDKVIRAVCLLEDGLKVVVMAMLEVLIIDTSTGIILGNIKRLSAPKSVMAISEKHQIIIHFCDNYCLVYDTYRYEVIQIIIGIFSDHNGIKASENGLHLLYGNNTAIQMWNMPLCQIELLSHQFKFISAYAINRDGSQIYLGNYYGEIHFVKIIALEELKYNKAPIGESMKVHSQCLMGLEVIDSNTIASIDFILQVAIIKSSSSVRTKSIICKIGLNLQIGKQIQFIFSRQKKKLYLRINNAKLKIGLDGETQIIQSSNQSSLLTNIGKEKVYIAAMPQKNSLLFTEV